MVDKNITEVEEQTTAPLTAMVYLVQDPSGIALDKKITVDNLLSYAARAGVNDDITSLSNLNTIGFSTIKPTAGVRWREGDDSYYRSGVLEGCAGSESFATDVHVKMKRCVIDNYGNIIHYLDPDNSYYADGVSATVSGTITADTINHLSDMGQFTSGADAYKGYYAYNLTTDTYALILDKYSNNALLLAQDIFFTGDEYEICTGAIGGVLDYSVMVEIPKFYYRYAYTNGEHSWEISEYPQSGFSVHPAFIKNGSEVDNRYMSAYEGTGWDYLYGGYIDHANTTTGWDSATAIDLDENQLCSISGWNPVTNEYRSSFRAIAANRGTGWRQFDYNLLFAIQLLYIVEYADWNSQDMIGGRTGLTGGTWTKESYIGITGKSNLDGNHTNSVTIGGTSYTTDYMTYRGIENLFGNVYSWIDGYNVNNRNVYVSNTDTDFADSTLTNYTDLEVVLPVTGWIKLLHPISGGFVPSVIGGSSTTYLTDYQESSSSWRTAIYGGASTTSVTAGIMMLKSSQSHISALSYAGGRLCY